MIYDPISVDERVIEQEMYHRDERVLTYSIRYPEFASAIFRPAANAMNRHYRLRAALQRQRYRQNLYPQAVRHYEYAVSRNNPFHAYEAVINHFITYNGDCTVSLYADDYQFTGGAHGNTVRSSDTWDLKSARRLPVSHYFAPSVPYQDYIIQSVNAQIAAGLEDGSGMYFDDYQQNVAQRFNPRSFFLDPAGLVVYFQQYQIAPYASGIPEFTLPYSQEVRPPRCPQG